MTKAIPNRDLLHYIPKELLPLYQAAPELLEACKLAYQTSKLPKDVHEVVINAIAKAEGR